MLKYMPAFLTSLIIGLVFLAYLNKEPLKPTAKEPVKPTAKEPVKPTAKEPVKPTAKEPVKPTAKEDETLLAWLDCQRKGETGYRYWLEGIWKSRLFSLESYEIVAKDDFVAAGGAIFTVRIHSSNEGGIPIVDLWRIVINYNGKILLVETNDAWLERFEKSQ